MRREETTTGTDRTVLVKCQVEATPYAALLIDRRDVDSPSKLWRQALTGTGGTMIRKAVYAAPLAALLGIAIAALPSAAQDQQAPPPGTYRARADNQQDRIANGVQSGQLTAGETKSLEGQEASVNAQARADRASDDGHLTAADRSQLNGEQNHLSNEIHADKHNATTAHYGNNEVGQRRYHQQQRIANGIRSGNLSAGQASHLEGRAQGINRQIHADRAANGGKLTGAEKGQINHEQNHTSRAIYRDKHK